MTEFENLIRFGNSKRKIGSSYNQWTQMELCFITVLTSTLKSLNDFNKHENNNLTKYIFIFFLCTHEGSRLYTYMPNIISLSEKKSSEADTFWTDAPTDWSL